MEYAFRTQQAGPHLAIPDFRFNIYVPLIPACHWLPYIAMIFLMEHRNAVAALTHNAAH